MNLGGLVSQHTAPMIAVILSEDSIHLQDNALEDELAQARASLPPGSFFAINSCGATEYPLEYLSNHLINTSSTSTLERPSEKGDALIVNLFKAFQQTLGMAYLFFEGKPKDTQKYVVLVKNSKSSTTVKKSNYLSFILKKCMEENCHLVRMNSSNPHEITALVDDEVIGGGICARMEDSSWGWLSKKTKQYIKKLRSQAAEVKKANLSPSQPIQMDKVLEVELLAIAKGVQHI